ncbi:MAG: UvrD-helicase domain-containing protein [Burkholderiales bacterium]|nr:UvrD-helicase domain-containing protein [Burkholderiales bacterium]MCE7877782.1 ATP-dependent DNA helicase Rep [Betaproteobacteria bacterium PRO3]
MSFPLNPAQAAAVRRTDAPMLVLAGAGSGKTRVIAAKVAHLIAQGVDPARIVAVTFTNKAAREMRERVDGLLADRGRRGDASAVRIQTFHALGLAIVRAEAKTLGLRPGFSVLDPQDLESIVGELVASADRSRVRRAQWAISRWKNALVAPAVALREAVDADEKAAAKAYAHYADALAAYQAVDFDDLIRLPVELLERDAEVRERWRARCEHLLVDEVQDTNPAQYRLFRALVGERARFTAVGDDDQAIYGWRGATVENLAQLERDYPALVVVKLEQNYRSTTRILASANALIANNAKLHDKRLWSDRGHGDAIRVVAARDEEAEAEIVAAAISAHRFEHRGRWSDYAVLYRGNHQSRAFEAAMRAQSIPCEVSGGQSWFDRAEIKDLVAYLRLVANEDDDPAFLRAVSVPRRGVGQATLAKLAQAATAERSSLARAIRSSTFAAAAQSRAHETLVRFADTIAELRRRAPREPAGRLIDELLRAIAWEDHLVSTFDKREAEAKSRSVREFAAWLARKGEADRKSLLDLTQTIALITMLEGRDGEGADAVRLSTLHAAKGLEFPHVFLVGLEEGLLPHRESIDAGTIDEERRLLYVGLTRAERSLHLSFCRTRSRAGGRVDCQPSRFLKELAQDDLRWAGQPLPADEAAREKAAGAERLKAMKAALAARGS